MGVRSVKELTVYKKAFDLAMRIFEISKRFPVDERFSLTSQIRRSSRSIEVGRMLGKMIISPDPFLLTPPPKS